MPVRVGWLLKDRIFVVASRGKVTDEEFFELDSLALEYLKQSPHLKVHVIFDNTHLDNQPGFVTQTKAKVGRHEKFGMAIVVGATNPFIKFVSSAATQFLGIRLRFVDDMDTACDILQNMLPDAKLPQYDQVDWVEHIDWDINASPTDFPDSQT